MWGESKARRVELSYGWLALTITPYYSGAQSTHRRTWTIIGTSISAYMREEWRAMTCFTGAQHLGSRVLSQLNPRAKPQ